MTPRDGYFIKEYCTPNIFIITEEGNYLFSDPQYEGGTNKLTKTTLTANQWKKGRYTYDIGGRSIKDYCGEYQYEP